MDALVDVGCFFAMAVWGFALLAEPGSERSRLERARAQPMTCAAWAVGCMAVVAARVVAYAYFPS